MFELKFVDNENMTIDFVFFKAGSKTIPRDKTLPAKTAYRRVSHDQAMEILNQ
jgi:hypothetical protein